MRKVWRIEDARGLGPYNGTPGYGEVYCLAIGKDRTHYGTQPGPYDDFSRQALESMRGSAKLFGFHTLRAAVRWFGASAIRELRKHGYYLKQVPATNVIVSHSGRQCMFTPPDDHAYRRSSHWYDKRAWNGIAA